MRLGVAMRRSLPMFWHGLPLRRTPISRLKFAAITACSREPPDIAAIGTFLADPENNKYKPVHGIAPLLQAIELKLRGENAIHPDAQSRLFVTPGGNMGFMNAVLAIADPGDEIILLTPYYFN